jgi:uncharacterized protein (TIGR00369 family)
MRALPPYTGFLGIRVDAADGDAPQLIMPFGDHLLGRPGFLHGGTIAGLLEIAAFAALYRMLGDEKPKVKPINVTVDFMRGGRVRDTRAEGRVTRIGTRIANVTAEAWQDDRSKPIAIAKMNLLLDRG